MASIPPITIMVRPQAFTSTDPIVEGPQATIMDGFQALIPPGTILVRLQALTPTATIMDGSQALTPQATILKDYCRGSIMEGPQAQATFLVDCCGGTTMEGSQAMILEGSQALISPGTLLVRPQALSPTESQMCLSLLCPRGTCVCVCVCVCVSVLSRKPKPLSPKL